MGEDVRNLYFKRSNGEYLLLATNLPDQKIYIYIQDFLDKHNFKSYYTRTWEVNGERWFDVGSHTEFFVWKKE